MCRLYGFRSNEETKVECTLARAQNALLIQSRGDMRGISHSDGWGIGFYRSNAPAVERRAAAAHADLHFGMAAERVFSETVIAHVRKATVGQPQIANTHPFTHGPWIFAHNGTVTGFEHVAPRMEDEIPPHLCALRRGTTDSELAFYWLLARMERAGISPERPADTLPPLAELLGTAVAELAGWCAEADPTETPRLNFLLTDGHYLIATRWNHTLYWVERDGIRDCEICGIPHVHHTPGFPYRAVIVASEPISHEEWQEVPDRSVVVVDGSVHTRIVPIGTAN